MTEADKAIAAIERLPVPQGRLAGDNIVLADYQRRFIEGALADGVSVAAWSIGRGNAKTATAAALAVTHLIGEWGVQPQREIVIAGRTKEQAAVAFRFAQTFLENLPDDLVTFGKVQTREHPHFSLKIEADAGPHELRAISADGKSARGRAMTAPAVPSTAIADGLRYVWPPSAETAGAAFNAAAGDAWRSTTSSRYAITRNWRSI